MAKLECGFCNSGKIFSKRTRTQHANFCPERKSREDKPVQYERSKDKKEPHDNR